jgi:transmembrane sensor
VRLRLSDGTEVILGAGSSLRQTGTLGAGAREVVLEGQAYFAVAHDAHRPFVVRAGGLVATDRGTEFSVRAYPEDGRARVSVRSGMVAVRAAPAADGSTYDNVESVVLPGQAGWLGADGMLLIQPIDTAAAFAWTRGTLVFDGTPLHEALPELSRWYDLDFRLADPALGAIPLSGSLDQTLTPDRLNLLAASLGLEEVRSGNTVTFHRGGGTAH